jgi:hypothetical protein
LLSCKNKRQFKRKKKKKNLVGGKENDKKTPQQQSTNNQTKLNTAKERPNGVSQSVMAVATTTTKAAEPQDEAEK